MICRVTPPSLPSPTVCESPWLGIVLLIFISAVIRHYTLFLFSFVQQIYVLSVFTTSLIYKSYFYFSWRYNLSSISLMGSRIPLFNLFCKVDRSIEILIGFGSLLLYLIILIVSVSVSYIFDFMTYQCQNKYVHVYINPHF